MFRKALLGSSLLVIACLAAPVFGLDYWATELDDVYDGSCTLGSCSLRDAVTAANLNPGTDTIHLVAGTYLLTREGTLEDGNVTGDLDILDDVLIVGQGPGVSIIDANRIDRALHIASSVSGTLLRGLTITDGGALDQGGDGGGAVWNEGGGLTIRSCELVNNWTQYGDPTPQYGGAINSSGSGSVWIYYSTLTGNLATTWGGAVANRGTGNLTIFASTLFWNAAGSCGGAVLNQGGHASIDRSTLSENSGGPGCGDSICNIGTGTMDIVGSTVYEVYQEGYETIYNGIGATLELTNTAIIGPCNNLGTITTHGGNMETPGDTCSLGIADAKNIASSGILELAMNGGATMTHRFSPISWAVDFAPADWSCAARDQRGVLRPQDGNGDLNAVCDVGAVEYIIGEIVIHNFESGYTTGWSSIVR
jgi:hypothetical protein